MILSCTSSRRATWADLADCGDVDQRPGAADLDDQLMLSVGFGLLPLRLVLDAIGYLACCVSGREVTPLPPISGTEELAP